MHDDERATTVGDHATVQQVQRRRDHRRREHVLDGHRLAIERERIERRMRARGHRDLGQLFGRRAVLVHVPARHHRVESDGRRAVQRLELVEIVAGDALARADGDAGRARCAAVGDQRHAAAALRDRRRRVIDVRDERRAADGRAVDVLGIEVQIVDDRQRTDARIAGDGEVAVDVLLREPGVFERGTRRQRLDLEHALGSLALGELVHARDQRLRRHLALRGRAWAESPRSQ